MKKAMSLLVFGMFLFLVGIVSAEIAFTGTVYGDNDPIVELGGVDVTITCDGVDSDTVTTSANGAYGTAIASCADGDALTYTLSLSNYEDARVLGYEGTYNSSYEIHIFDKIVYVTNFILSEKTTISNNGGRRSNSNNKCTDSVWSCDVSWNECSDGEQTRQCVSNCGTDKTEIQQCNVEVEETEEIILEDEDADIIEGTSEPGAVSKFFSGITGAVIGGGSSSLIIAVVFLVLVIGAFIGVSGKKKRMIQEMA